MDSYNETFHGKYRLFIIKDEKEGGEPFTGYSDMKKLVVSMLCLITVSLFVLTACNSGNTEQVQEGNETVEVTSSQQNTTDDAETLNDEGSGNESNASSDGEDSGTEETNTVDGDNSEQANQEGESSAEQTDSEDESSGEQAGSNEDPGNDSSTNSESPEADEEDENNNNGESDVALNVEALAVTIVEALKNHDMETVVAHSIVSDNEGEGLLFSPYIYIENNALTLTQSELLNFFSITSTYTWGVEDGTGFPIELTPSDYFNRYVYNKDYSNPDEVHVNNLMQRGNLINNVASVFPGAAYVEFFIEGDPNIGGMDWGSLLFVFEQNTSGYYQLVAIVHDEWTI
ncbi:hypothetical protein EJF36_06895 [Bacillus sp. HMF5848]|uniref:hypothetical protein n=1 Tax=Bacillus sp. HMF5848 TaxID=2495421 RepID=UPI000F7A2FE3|nr:hypothetical protein [Bacillus sp. HMF5848]RSK26605.1 hypothetical protein EJF36_06895 [Bacillus sp. HMF5848]